MHLEAHSEPDSSDPPLRKFDHNRRDGYDGYGKNIKRRGFFLARASLDASADGLLEKPAPLLRGAVSADTGRKIGKANS